MGWGIVLVRLGLYIHIQYSIIMNDDDLLVKISVMLMYYTCGHAQQRQSGMLFSVQAFLHAEVEDSVQLSVNVVYLLCYYTLDC